MRRIGLGLLFVAAVVTVGQLVWFGGELPDPVASHFGLDGQPDSWVSRTSFLAMHGLVQIGTTGFMLATAYGMKWIPESLLNMPNKEYWLHADRREQSLRKNGSMLILIAGLTALFMAFVFQLVCESNLQGNRPLSTGALFWVLGVYLFAVIGVAVYALWTFRMPDAGVKDVVSVRNDV